MSAPVTRLWDLADATLTAIVDGWPADHEPLPPRRYVHVGTPAQDAAQLVVWVPRTVGTGNANVGRQDIVPQNQGLVGMRTAILIVQVLRAVPIVDGEGTEVMLPTPTVLSAMAKVLLGDTQAVLNCVIEAQDKKRLAGWGNLAFEAWDAIDANGGLSGGQQRLRLGAW